MQSCVQYQVVPLESREHNAKQDFILDAKYKTGCKKITLNERFGVIEKGYFLEAVEDNKNSDPVPVHLFVHERNLISKKDFVEKYQTKNPASAMLPPPIEENKENAPTKKSSEPRSKEAEKEFLTDLYILEVSKTILGSK